ncbi:MAG: aminoglycoside phosphotransferase family protein [Chloroflexota bacterium]|nr:aminoglycoside phosphotransferase family protein [Chloroflexota bacterium]
MPDEMPLAGGNITPVSRVGTVVHRAAGPWTQTVHELLRHLRSSGFDRAPRPLGFDAQGGEMLTFIEGVAGFFSADGTSPPNLWSDQVLVEAARLLRRFHDATRNFVSPAGATWQLTHPDVTRHEVICHNDFAPYNLIFVDGEVHAMIDFDTAGPGPAIWDVAYAAYRFVPLVAPERLASLGWHEPPATGLRLKRFCDAYGLDQRHGFLDAVQERIEATRRMLIDGAAAGHAGYQRIIDEGGHIEGLEADRAFVEAHAQEFQNWVDKR